LCKRYAPRQRKLEPWKWCDMIHFANPLALWALLALPVILAIHCLQERARRLRVSTLFLLERVAPKSASGARFERLRNSLPLWLQLIAAALIAWLLAEPRWVRADSVQTIVVVLDSSASMSAFKDEAKTALNRTLGRWSQNAVKTQWQVLETDASKPTLYSGTQLDEALTSLDRWHPMKGTHSADDAFMIARSFVKDGHGIVIHVTDHKIEVPSYIALIAVGVPKDNAGFSGIEVKLEQGRMKWRALVTNHGATTQSRTWWIEHKLASEPTKSKLDLQAGQSVAIQGELPSEIEQATLHLEGDLLPLDDQLPMQKPVERAVRIDARLGGESGELLKKMIAALPGVVFTTDQPDISLAEIGTETGTDAILIDAPAPKDAKLDAAMVVAETHALTRELNWMGLLTPKPSGMTLLDSDTPLLWKGDTALAFLRRTTTADGKVVQQLLLNWDLAQSNAHRWPALLILLQRHLEALRAGLDGERAGNYELNERIELRTKSGLEMMMNQVSQAFVERAPERVGFFEVKQGEQRLVRGASHFADAREANLRECSSADTTESRRTEAALRETEADPLKALWVLLVLGCLMGAWGAGKK